MARVWMYAMKSNNDPDNVSCVVPRRVDDDVHLQGRHVTVRPGREPM
jgi:hypothetical protein